MATRVQWLGHSCLLIESDGKRVLIGDYYTMGPADSIRAIKLLEPQAVIPIHFNTFPPIRQDVHAWAGRVNQETASRPVLLEAGDWFNIR